MSADTPYLMQWDVALDEPYIPVTPDIRITPLRMTDVDGWTTLYNYPDISKGSIRRPSPYPHELALEEVANVVEDAAPIIAQLREGKGGKGVGGSPFEVIRAYPSGEIMGTINIHASDRPLPPLEPLSDLPWVNDTWDVGYNMAPQYTGKGLTKAALQALIEGYLKPVMKLKLVAAGSRATNFTSHSVLKRCGFVKEGDYERTLPPELGGTTFACVKWVRTL